MVIRILAALGLLLAGTALLAPCQAADGNAPSMAANYSVARLLASARNNLSALEHAEDEQAREIALRGAVVSLTGLYRMHGCEWAWPKLVEIATDPDCPEMYYGITADGRMTVTVDRLDLRNPVFDGFALYLCTFESVTAEVLEHGGTSQQCLEFRLPDGTAVQAEELAPGHPLWDQLKSMEKTFYPPDAMYPGGGYGFKQIFSLPAGGNMGAASLVINWGGYSLELPVFRGSDDD